MSSLLLGKEATGGEIARDGLSYQDSFGLLNLPQWLAQGAFAGILSETIGDLEVCYFTLSGERRIFLEAKDYVLTPKPFWDEMERFREVFEKAGGLYTRFGFVAPEMPRTLAPMFSKLSRIRGVGAAFDPQAKLLADAKQDYTEWVCSMAGQSAELAEFVLNYVDFFPFDATAAEQRFSGELTSGLPCFEDLPASRFKILRLKWADLVQQSTKRRVSRREFEDAILNVLPESEHVVWLESPNQVTFVRGTPGENPPRPYELVLDLRPYLGEDRGSRTAEEWAVLVKAADAIGGFLQSSRNRRRVRLDSELRMSSAVALGMAFKATKGHLLEITHRGCVFSLHHLENRSKEAFFHSETLQGEGVDGIAIIQIGQATRADMHNALSSFSLAGAPRVYLECDQVIADIERLNAAVHEAKTILNEFRSRRQLKRIHLFVKGPSFFAMALGHRINALGEIQLYDWVENSYKATVRLSV